MSSATSDQDRLRQQASNLYWHSEDTVEQLASRLGMSRKAVYAAVQPLDVGVTCTACGEPLVFSNRTSRAAGMANCLGCEAQVTLGEEQLRSHLTLADRVAEDADGSVRAVPVAKPQRRLTQLKEELAAVPPGRAAKIGGAAALGVAIGAAAVKAIKKRS
jgi:hypothetical protein